MKNKKAMEILEQQGENEYERVSIPAVALRALGRAIVAQIQENEVKKTLV